MDLKLGEELRRRLVAAVETRPAEPEAMFVFNFLSCLALVVVKTNVTRK